MICVAVRTEWFLPEEKLSSRQDWQLQFQVETMDVLVIKEIHIVLTYKAPRSGLALKNFIDTGAGVIDEDYRGEGISVIMKTKLFLVGIVLFNHSEQDFHVKVGDRIAQLIIEKISDTSIIEVDKLDDTNRGAGGFGSTGVNVDISKSNDTNRTFFIIFPNFL